MNEDEIIVEESTNESIDEPTNEINTEKSFNVKLNTRIIAIITTIIIVVVLATIVIGYVLYKNSHQPQDVLSPSHVYVCDSPEPKSEFDLWIKNDLQLTGVPSYVIINDGSVVGVFPGDLDEEEFSDKLMMTYTFNLPVTEVPRLEISNITGDRHFASDLFSEGKYILEVHWIDCEDCQHQDENYTHDIYSKYSTNRIYRYYIKSEVEPVKEKYNVN